MYQGRAMWLMPDDLGTPAGWGSRLTEDKAAILRHCINGQAWIPSLRLADWCLSAAWEYGDILVVIDEAHNIWHRELSSRDGRLRILLEGRRRGVSVIMATQRPALLHVTAQNVMTAYAIGTATMNADAELYRKLVGLKESMPLHQFLLYNPSVEPRSTTITSRALS